MAKSALVDMFPQNIYLKRLISLVKEMGISIEKSPVPTQWFYHPGRRIIYVWPPDLQKQSITYLTVVLVHELGHALDFDCHPDLHEQTTHLQPNQMPIELEFKAFVYGFSILQRLEIPINIIQYTQMIEAPMDQLVRIALEKEINNNQSAYGA